MNYRFLRTLGLGVGAALIAMAVYPIIAKAAKPLIKNIIKESINMKDKIGKSPAEKTNEN